MSASANLGFSQNVFYFSSADVTSWREGGGRNLQPSSLPSALPSDPESKSSNVAEIATPPPPSHPSSASVASILLSASPLVTAMVVAAPPSPDLKEPSLRPAQPLRRSTPSSLQYQLHHSPTTVYHDMLPAFVSTACTPSHTPRICAVFYHSYLFIPT